MHILSAVVESSTSIKLFYEELDDEYETVDLRYTKEKYENHTTIKDISKEGELSDTISDLDVGTTYFFQIRATHDCGDGDWSDYISATTLDENESPSDLSITDVVAIDKLPVSTPTPSPTLNVSTFGFEPDSVIQVPTTIADSLVIETKFLETLIVKILDKDKKPVVGATVLLYSEVREEITDEMGTVTFENVERGTHTLEVKTGDVLGSQEINIDPSTTKTLEITVTLEKKESDNDNKALVIYGIVGSVVFILILISTVVFIKRKNIYIK